VLLLATYRDDEFAREDPLSLLIPSLVREGSVHRFPLQRLGTDDVRELVRDRYRLVPDDEKRLTAYIIEMAQGNPFFINELLHALGEDDLLSPMAGGWRVGDLSRAGVPALVQQVIERRLARLDCATRDLLDVMAAIGFDVPLDLLRDVQGGSTVQLDHLLGEIVEHRLLELKSDRRTLRFNHALVRQTIYEHIPPFRRQQLHLEIGDSLAERSQPNPSNVANHLYRAGDKRAIEWLIRAAQQAQAVYAPEIVLLQCERAIELAGHHGQEAPIAAYRLRGLAREMVGDFDGALDDHETALQLARENGDQRAEWQGLLDLAVLWASRDRDRMGDYCRQAVSLARMMDDPASLGHSLNRLGNWYANAMQPHESLRHHEEALEIFEDLDDRQGIASTLDLIALAHFFEGDMDATLRAFERAIPLLRQIDDRQTLASALSVVTETAGIQHHRRVTRIQELRDAFGVDPGQLLAEAIAVAHEIGSRSGEAFALSYVGRWQASTGNYEQAIAIGKRAVEIAEQIEHLYWILNNHLTLGLTYREILALDRAGAMYERARQAGKTLKVPAMEDFAQVLLASVYILDEKYDRAGQLLANDFDLDTPLRSWQQKHRWITHAELALARKRYDDALQIVDGVIDSIPGERGVLSPQLTLLRGEALFGVGRLDAAETTIKQTLNCARQIGYPSFIWPAWASLRKLYLEQGRIDEAEEARRAAMKVVRQMADSLEDDELRENFLKHATAQLPRSLPFTATRSASGLTQRETEVLRLVSEGLTDAQIADRLYISSRTVTAHVSNLLAKLDVPNRAAASRVAVERELI
jgi:DNA-binding CsgD family transcriptional regulator